MKFIKNIAACYVVSVNFQSKLSEQQKHYQQALWARKTIKVMKWKQKVWSKCNKRNLFILFIFQIKYSFYSLHLGHTALFMYKSRDLYSSNLGIKFLDKRKTYVDSWISLWRDGTASFAITCQKMRFRQARLESWPHSPLSSSITLLDIVTS